MYVCKHNYHESRGPDEDLVIWMIREIPAVGSAGVIVTGGSWIWFVVTLEPDWSV